MLNNQLIVWNITLLINKEVVLNLVTPKIDTNAENNGMETSKKEPAK